MPAAVASRSWMSRPTAGLGFGPPRAQSSAGGADFGQELSVSPRLHSHSCSCPSLRLQGLRYKLSKLLFNTAVMGTKWETVLVPAEQEGPRS